MSAVYIVNTYDSKGRPFADEGACFTAKEHGDAEALRLASEAYDWYAAHGQNVKLIKAS